MLLSGDTIFPGSHGRCDLEESEPESLFSSDGVRRVAELQDDLRIYPGHTYGGRHTTVGGRGRRVCSPRSARGRISEKRRTKRKKD